MSQNRRVQMTKHFIKEAFIDLMENAPINKITVKEICQRADVNRSTFYAHYGDQYELFYEIQEDIINITPQVSLYNKEPISSNLESFFKFIEKNKRIYKILFANSTGTKFRNRVINKIFNRDGESLEWISAEMNLSEKMDFKMLIYAFGGMGMIEKWIFGEIDESAENLAKYMAEFIKKV